MAFDCVKCGQRLANMIFNDITIRGIDEGCFEVKITICNDCLAKVLAFILKTVPHEVLK